MQKKLAIVAAVAIALTSLASIVFWARLSGRLPTDDDYRKANDLIASHLEPGDVIVLAPAWADRGRQFLTAASVNAGYDLANDSYPGTKRQWLVALADSPRFSLEKTRATLLARGPSAMPGQRLGGLWVEPFSIADPPVLYSFLDKLPEAIVTLEGQDAAPEECPKGSDGAFHCSKGSWNHVRAEWHELDERPIHCIWAHPVNRAALRLQYDGVPLGGHIHGWGAFVSDAVQPGGAPVYLQVEVNGQRSQPTEFPNEVGKHEFDVPIAANASAGRVTLSVTTPNNGRRFFCFDAWVSP